MGHPITPLTRATGAPAPTASELRVDVLVALEDVVMVVTPLDRDETLPVRRVGVTYEAGVVGGQVVDVVAGARERAERLERVSCPADVRVVVAGIEPLAEHQHAV